MRAYMDFPEDIYSTRILEVVASMPEMGLLDQPEGLWHEAIKIVWL